jgi:hypothetical protein
MNTKKTSLVATVVISGLVSVIMIVIGYLMVSGENGQRIWHALLINYLFFTSAAAGMIVWPAIVIVSNGKWMGSLEKVCWTGISFSVPSIVSLVVLWIGSKDWAPWIGMVHQKAWLNNTFLFTRNLSLLIVFWIIAFFFLRNRYKKNNIIIAGWLIFVYAITFSMTGFDFVMSLEPEWYSMMAGGYFFISGLYIASAAWAFLSVILAEPVNKSSLHDIGKLMMTFCMLTSYLMFSQLLPIWYENLPEETVFLIPRINLTWKPISFLLLGLVYLGPVLLLLNRWVKQNTISMGAISLLILIGMWIERWWLVSAVFEKDKILFGWEEIVPTIVFAGLMMTGIMLIIRIKSFQL